VNDAMREAKEILNQVQDDTSCRFSMTKLRIALVVPHMFMHRSILPQVIFSPGHLALDLANGLQQLGAEVTLFTPGPVDTTATNVTADLSYFENELKLRGDTYLSLLKKHPLTFITLARQVQSELIAKAFQAANAGEFDIVHMYTNEEDTALPFAALCNKPVVFTHHDPYNFMVKYKNNFPKYKHLHWISFSYSQRRSMPADTNWVANIYHGFTPTPDQQCARLDLAQPYFAYLGRIIEPKGVHLAIAAVKEYNKTAPQSMKLKIAGKHYGDSEKHSYWLERIQPELSEYIEYVGFIDSTIAKQKFLASAAALLVPSVFEEPFGMVSVEALAVGTPVIALDSGALPEVVEQGKTGWVAKKVYNAKTLNEPKTIKNLQSALTKWPEISRKKCKDSYSARFTTTRMCEQYLAAYKKVL